jgi:dTDP-4-amino-4,6-dideoxygalactose transaminase
MKIRIGDFPLGKDERDAIQRVVDSGRITEHREVKAFENEFAEWVGAKHCVALSSGTAALITGLSALKFSGRVKDDARVLIPALTFVATANAVQLSGMTPVFGDVGTLDMCLVPTYISWDIDIVMPVHLFGFMPNMKKMKAESRMHRAVLVEDACEAHGSVFCKKKAGTFGLWGTFSFFIAHTIQAGELGALVTDDDEIATLARRIKAHGRECACKICVRSTGQCPNMRDHDPRYQHVTFGYNFKPMEFSAALARVQLKKVEQNIQRRRENVIRLTRGLRSIENKLILPHISRDISYMMCPLIFRRSGIRNKALVELEKQGVECRPLFGCIPLQQPAYAHLARQYKNKLPVSEFYGANGFFVGCHQYLSNGDVDYMVKAITKVVKELDG